MKGQVLPSLTTHSAKLLLPVIISLARSLSHPLYPLQAYSFRAGSPLKKSPFISSLFLVFIILPIRKEVLNPFFLTYLVYPFFCCPRRTFFFHMFSPDMQNVSPFFFDFSSSPCLLLLLLTKTQNYFPKIFFLSFLSWSPSLTAYCKPFIILHV